MAKLIETPNGETSMFGNRFVGTTYSDENGNLYTGKAHYYVAFLPEGKRWYSDVFSTEQEAWDAAEAVENEIEVWKNGSSEAKFFACVNGKFRETFDYNFSSGNARVVVKDK